MACMRQKMIINLPNDQKILIVQVLRVERTQTPKGSSYSFWLEKGIYQEVRSKNLGNSLRVHLYTPLLKGLFVASAYYYSLLVNQ